MYIVVGNLILNEWEYDMDFTSSNIVIHLNLRPN